MQKIRRVGGSLMVCIPKEIAEYERLKEGETIFYEIKKKPIDAFGLFPSVGPWKKEPDEFHSKYL